MSGIAASNKEGDPAVQLALRARYERPISQRAVGGNLRHATVGTIFFSHSVATAYARRRHCVFRRSRNESSLQWRYIRSEPDVSIWDFEECIVGQPACEEAIRNRDFDKTVVRTNVTALSMHRFATKSHRRFPNGSSLLRECLR